MADTPTIMRNIPFSREAFEEISALAEAERRAFRNQTALLIEEALEARRKLAADHAETA